MASYSCCISYNPPSPDGLPPRPVESPSKSHKNFSKDPVAEPSWSTAFGFSKPEDAAKLRAIFEDDKSDTGEEHSNLMTKRSSSTLNTVKSKLRRHFSRESTLLKRQSRSTVGTSEEEIERRKELKLIRNRRIQEELNNEGVYDEDARSLSTLASVDSPPRTQWHTMSTKGNSLSPALLLPPPHFISNNTAMSADGHDSNPLDSLEAITSPRLSKRWSDAWVLESHKPSRMRSVIQRRHSSAALNRPETPIGTPPGWTVPSESPPCSIPPAPVLKPQRLPSIVDPATRRTSWRLSFSSDQRACQLRALSQEYGASSEPGARVGGTRIGPIKWLWNQGIPMPLATTETSESPNDLDSLPSDTSLCADTEGYGGIGGVELQPPPVSLHKMQISQRLASRGLHNHSSSPQLSSWGSKGHHRSYSYVSGVSHSKTSSQSRHHCHTSSSGIIEPKHHPTQEIVPRDGISSLYPSTENSVQLTPKSSQFHLTSVQTSKKSNSPSQASDLKVPIVIRASSTSMASITAADVNASTPALGIPFIRQGRRLTADSSILASETSSFREREAELDVIKTRFPRSMERRGPSSPVQSRFKEEFGEAQTTTQTRSSILSAMQIPRIAKLASRSYDGASPFELQVPQHRQGFGFLFSNRSHSSPGTISPGESSPGSTTPVTGGIDPFHLSDDDTQGIWAWAWKGTRDEHALQCIAELNLSKERKDNHGSFMAIRSLSRKLTGKKKASMNDVKEDEPQSASEDDRDFELERILRRQERRIERERKADAWANELDAREREAKANTAAVARRGSRRRIVVPPESWARYPSHTREERTTSAGHLDKVSLKDFAIKDVKDSVTEWMVGDRKRHHRHYEKQHRSLLIRVSNQIRTTLYKMRTAKSTAMSDAVHGRKSSVSVGGKLEYPELELLPGEAVGSGQYEEVERETEAEMRRDERIARMMVFGDGDGGVEDEGEDDQSDLEVGETPQISIADPKFYEDCVTLPVEDGNGDDVMSMKSFTTLATLRLHLSSPLDSRGLKKGKCRTWSGRDRASTHFLSTVALRRSTVDFQTELEQMERMEKARVISSAEKAWGKAT